MKKFRFICIFVVLSVAVVAPVAAEGLLNRRHLVDEFVKGLAAGRKYGDVAHLFVSVDDFDALIGTLKQADLPPSYRQQLEGADNLQKQRDMLRQIDKQLVERWDGLITEIKGRNLTVALKNFDAQARTNANKVTFLELALSFDVTEGGRSKQVTRVLRAMQLNGKLKIVALFKGM